MASADSTAQEFQRRRIATWRGIRWLLLIAIAGLVAIIGLVWNAPRYPENRSIGIGLTPGRGRPCESRGGPDSCQNTLPLPCL
jgi:hypothetical protein